MTRRPVEGAASTAYATSSERTPTVASTIDDAEARDLARFHAFVDAREARALKRASADPAILSEFDAATLREWASLNEARDDPWPRRMATAMALGLGVNRLDELADMRAARQMPTLRWWRRALAATEADR
jgi:hypothetical protein